MKNRRALFAVLVLALLIQGVPLPANAAATLSFSPTTKAVEVDDTFTITLSVNTGGQAINAAEATINFPTDKLDVKSISKSGSIFSLWAVDPKFSNSAGTITFSGGKPSPGFTGSAGRIISVTFQAQATGTARLTISGAQVLANDGLGTDIFGGAGSSTITVNKKTVTPTPTPTPGTPAPTITSTSHPDQNVWSLNRNVSATWTAGAGATGYSVLFEKTKDAVPPETVTTTSGNFSKEEVADGTWYLAVRARYASGWSSVTSYTVNIDATAPEPFTVTVEQRNTSDANPKFVFAATDAASGVEKYELRLDEAEFVAATSPQQVMNVSRGEHTVTVRATDKVGNVRDATTAFSVGRVPSLNVVYDHAVAKTESDSELKLTFMIGDTIRLRGYAKINETIHVVIHSEETVFDFPVAEHIDPAPVEPAPPGYEAWKLDIPLNLPAGDHEIFVSTLDEQGNVTAEAAVVKFRIINNSVRVGNTYFGVAMVLKILLAVIAVFVFTTILFVILYIRLRRRVPKQGRYF